MNYSQSLDYLNQFINLEKISWIKSNRLYNLRRMQILLEWFGHPEKKFFPIVIAGTKGKGSTGFFLESILKAARIPVGFYSSPHLLEPTERIRTHGGEISRAVWIKEISHIKRVLSQKKLCTMSLRGVKRRSNLTRSVILNEVKDLKILRPAFSRPQDDALRQIASLPRVARNDVLSFTYFEVLTLLAILIFARQGVRVGIFEVGMGGRLDAVNILRAPLAILTAISLDHEAFLGNTLAKIAKEKAGVIHAGADIVTVPQKPEAMRVIEQKTKTVRAKLWKSEAVRPRPGLKGDYQKDNAGAALKAAQILRDRYGLLISEKASRKGIQSSGWPGRWQAIEQNPEIIIDGAHNPASIEAFVRSFRKVQRTLGTVLRKRTVPRVSNFAATPKQDQVLIFGTSRDKNAQAMLRTLGSYFDGAILTQSKSTRSYLVKDLMMLGQDYFKWMIPASSVEEAISLSKRVVSKQGRVVVTGSFYIIGEALQITKNQVTNTK